MFDQLAGRVNGNAALVRRGRHVNCSMLIEAGDERHLVRIREGAVVEVAKGGLLMSNFTFALRAPREAWESLWEAMPQPGCNDIFALFKRGLLRIEGDLHPFMANLLYFKDVLAAVRPKEAV